MNKKKICVVILLLLSIIIPQNNVEAKTKTNKNKTIKVSSSELRLLCAITQAEAGIEPYNGKIGVMNVIINRKKSKKFPNSFKKVIYAKGQFSPTWNGALKRELKAYDSGKFKKGSRKSTMKAVKAALNGKNTVGKRTFFNEYCGQRHKNSKRIGSHIFW